MYTYIYIYIYIHILESACALRAHLILLLCGWVRHGGPSLSMTPSAHSSGSDNV